MICSFIPEQDANVGIWKLPFGSQVELALPKKDEIFRGKGREFTDFEYQDIPDRKYVEVIVRVRKFESIHQEFRGKLYKKELILLAPLDFLVSKA